MNEFRIVRTKPGEVIPYETVFEENTRLRTGVPEKLGKVERDAYDTAVYGNGKTYHKYAYVYLPWCYDAQDKARKYNVFLTEAGTAAAEDVKNAPQDSVFDVLSDEEKEALNALLAKVIALNPELTEYDEEPMGKGPHHPHRRKGPPHGFLRQHR